MKVYKCAHCGNVLLVLHDGGVTPICCGEKMRELVPGSTDAALEKHVPVVERVCEHRIHVKVGSVLHPMTEEHLIEWIAIESEGDVQIHHLKAGDSPEAEFRHVSHGTVYAYCNLHGLWKTEF